MSKLVMSVKRLLRPLIPDRLMARYRLRQHSKAVRVNVDVLVADPAEASRWLSATPDTYRIVDPSSLGEAPEDAFVIVDEVPKGGAAAEPARLLSLPDIGAAMVGEVAQPRLVDRRRVEPIVAPTSMVVRPEVLADVGGVPAGRDLPGLLDRLRDAGHRIGLIPIAPSGLDASRKDPITAEPVVILAAVPMHDIGGGSRSAQIALELVARGYHVTYVHLYPSFEEIDLGLRFIHPNLEQIRFDRFVPAVHVERSAGRSGVALLELPAPRYELAAQSLRDAGWELVYDIIDDWSDPALGGEWYDQGLERRTIGIADAVVASAPDLVERAADAGAEAVLVPNAVNSELFAGGPTLWPPDLPDGRIIGYHGSLYGDWFDWDSVAAVAEANPSATVVLIGEGRGVPRRLPENVALLGLKAQQELPAYLIRFDVGMVPFAVTRTTHAVSPLKVYEYLASAVPVAAPPLRALDGLDGVYVDPDIVAAVGLALAAPRPDPGAVLRDHSWGNRVAAIFASLGRTIGPSAGDRVKVELRPAVHYPRGERKVVER